MRSSMTSKNLVGKYRAIFDWDVPDIDQIAAEKLILIGGAKGPK